MADSFSSQVIRSVKTERKVHAADQQVNNHAFHVAFLNDNRRQVLS